jgi:rod shape-determining protein MreC
MESRFRNIIVIVSVLVLLLSIGYSNGGRTSVTIVENIFSYVIIPTQDVLTSVSNSVTERINDVSRVFKYREEIRALEIENKVLKEENISLTLEEVQIEQFEALKKNLNYLERNNFNDYVTAKVVSKDSGNWFNMFTINAGLNQGLKKYSVVVANNGLVGKIYEVGDNYSKVITIVDNKSKISFEVLSLDQKYQGYIESTHDGLLTGRIFEPNANLKKGMTVITTGQGIYPEGLLIGKITTVIKDEDEFLQRVTIEPEVDFRYLKYVTVMTIDQEQSEWINEDN